MLKYNDFLLEAEFKKWEVLSDSSNESIGSLVDKIGVFLDKEYEYDLSGFEESVVNLLKRFKSKLKIVTIIVSLLLGGYMAKSKVSNVLDKAGYDKPLQAQILDSAANEREASTKLEPPAEYKETPVKQEPKSFINRLEDRAKKGTEQVKQGIKTGKNEVKKFLNALASSESSMNPKSVNRFGYIGKYQFGKKALEDLGLDDKINAHKFKKNPKIFPEHAQDKAMVDLLKINKDYLGDYINNYVGKVVAGVQITKSGLLAGSHLVGAHAVKQFLDSNGRIIPRDGNDVPVTEYIKKFGGYNLTF